jgi:integrase
MTPKRVRSKRTGATGWQFRPTDPATDRRTKVTFWIGERREAERAFQPWRDGREKLKLGLPDEAAWEMEYATLVNRFIEEAPISSKRRRSRLKSSLLNCGLGLRRARDLCNRQQLSAVCTAMARAGRDQYVRKDLQAPLKQMTRWAAQNGILPLNPLADWPLVKRTSEVVHRRALRPDEARAILRAADVLHTTKRRKHSMSLVYRVLLVTGNRPGALGAANVADFDGERINLKPGAGNKHNGAALLVPDVAEELREYVDDRKAKVGDPLLVSPRGKRLQKDNNNTDFVEAACLGLTTIEWPDNVEDVEPIEVSHVLFTGRMRGYDGPAPTNPKKIELRRVHQQRIAELAEQIGPVVRKKMERVSVYSLKATHITWARRLVSPDSVRVQVGHAGRDVEERHYLDVDLVNPKDSAQAVWDVLTGARSLDGGYRSPAKAVVGLSVVPHDDSEDQPATKQVVPNLAPKPHRHRKSCSPRTETRPQPVAPQEDRSGAGEGIRTLDFRLGKPALCH